MIKNRVFRVMFRFISACAALFIILLSICVGYFFIVVAPRNQAAQQQADLFLTLKGPARRVAIFDAATRIIEAQYYDHSFAGLNWPLLRSQSRVRAELAEDDFHLYWTVLVPLAMAFPASHMGFTMPPPAPVVAAPRNVKAEATPECEFDEGGVTLTSIQRKTGRFLMVAEVAVEDIEMLDGSHLEGKGVRPDVEVYPAPEDVRSGKDAALEAAIHALGF